MCYRPLHISNRKPDKNPLIDRFRLTVPCGHCIQCKDEKRMSMWIRSYYEFKYCQVHSGFALYITLTYRNSCLPKLSGDRKYVCFDKGDVQKYFKRFRQSLQRRYPSVNVKDKVKYFLSSEYGGKTHRPHYHAVFFFSYPFPKWTVRALLADAWDLGFIKFGSHNYGFVHSVGALHYVSKYICKDIYEDEYFKKFFEDFCRDYEVPQEHSRKYLKRFMPFYLLSNNFGMYALSCIDDEDLYFGRVLMPDSYDIKKFYKLPLYYDRKFFYDVKYKYYDIDSGSYVYCDTRPDVEEFSPVYTLNSKGSTMKIARLKKFYQAAGNVYVNSIQLNDDFDINRFNGKFNTHFETPLQLSGFIAKKIDRDSYARYNILYSGVNLPFSDSFARPEPGNFGKDYELVQNLKSNSLFLQRDLDNFCCNCVAYHDMPHIDLVSEMIAYIYYLCRLTFEKKRNKEEMEYVEKKSAYLRSEEIV